MRSSTNTHTNPTSMCCVYLSLRQAGRVRPLVHVLLRLSPPQAAEARMVRDFTSLATQRATDTHPPITGLDCWTDTGIGTANQHIISYGWKRCNNKNNNAWIKLIQSAAYKMFTGDSWGTPGVWLVAWKLRAVFMWGCSVLWQLWRVWPLSTEVLIWAFRVGSGPSALKNANGVGC